MNVGYARVSTSSQSLENQIGQLKAVGCEKVFSEKRSRKNETDRQQFQIMKNFVREGDVLFVTKLDRLARSVIDLHEFAKFLQEKDIGLKYYIKIFIQPLQQEDFSLQCLVLLQSLSET